MCKDELNEIEEMEDEQATLEDLSKDELIDVITQLMESKTIQVNTDDLQGLCLDTKEFVKGLKSISFIAGQYSGLNSIGIDSTSSIDILINMANTDFNLKLNEMTCKSNENTVRTQQIQLEQNQI